MRLDYTKADPAAWTALLKLSTHLTQHMDARLKGLVELRVSQINGCAYCLDMHARELRELGERPQRISCLGAWRESGLFDARERAALAWAECLTRIETCKRDDALYTEVSRHFNDAELAQLTFVITQMNQLNRLGIAFHSMPGRRED